MSCIVEYVGAVPTENREAHRLHAEESADVFKELGALQYVECWGEDVPERKVTSFAMAVKCRPNETVCFAWIKWASREACDAGMAKVRADPRMERGASPAPYDLGRMIHGGFEILVDRSREASTERIRAPILQEMDNGNSTHRARDH